MSRRIVSQAIAQSLRVGAWGAAAVAAALALAQHTGRMAHLPAVALHPAIMGAIAPRRTRPPREAHRILRFASARMLPRHRELVRAH